MTERISSNVHRITATKSLPLLIVSDVHYDSLHCDRESLKKHFDQIKEKNGKILIIGDWFDVMGCYKDPRSKAAQIDPKYIQRGRSYLDLVVEDSYEFLKPYKENIALITYGNHETAILKHRDTDPLERLLFLLNQNGGTVHKGAYAGWIICSIKRSSSINTSTSFNIAYHHGKGGGAQRSKGILYSQLDAMEYPDAHLIVSGHDHNKIYDPSNVRKRINVNGRVYTDSVHWLKTGSYAKSPDDFGFVVEKGFMGKRMGGWFCDLGLVRTLKDGKDTLYVEPTIYEAIPVR